MSYLYILVSYRRENPPISFAMHIQNCAYHAKTFDLNRHTCAVIVVLNRYQYSYQLFSIPL